MLAYPDFDREFILDNDASDVGIGAALSQVDSEGRERVIAYGSRLLSKPEQCYCIARRELLVVVVFTRQFRPYLAGQRFMLQTDHGSLTWLKNFKGQMAWWLEGLQELDFQIVHWWGRKHTNADALSRLPYRQCGRETHETTPIAIMTLMSTELSLRESQLSDPTIGPVLQRKESNQKPSADETKSMARASRRLFQTWDQLLVKDGVLYRQYVRPLDQESILQLVIPGAMQSEVIKNLHEGALGGHMGEEKTLARLKERFYWPGHYRDVHEWWTCPACASQKTSAPKGRAPLQNIKAGYA